MIASGDLSGACTSAVKVKGRLRDEDHHRPCPSQLLARPRCAIWGGRPISAKTYVSVLHAMLCVGLAAARKCLAHQKHRRALCVLHAKSSPALAPRFAACNTPGQTGIYRPMRGCKPKPPKILSTTNFPDFDGWRDCQVGLERASGLGFVSPTFRILTQIRKAQSTAAQFPWRCNNPHAWKRLPEFSAVWAYPPPTGNGRQETARFPGEPSQCSHPPTPPYVSLIVRRKAPSRVRLNDRASNLHCTQHLCLAWRIARSKQGV